MISFKNFFRLWLVLSIVWILLALNASTSGFSTRWNSILFDLTADNMLSPVFQASMGRALPGGLGIFIPPFAVMALGLLLAWVARAFKHGKR